MKELKSRVSQNQNKAEPLTLMMVHAHPDDEALGTGGTLAQLAEQGIRTVLVVATRGEAGAIVDPGMDQAARQQAYEKLGDLRWQELQEAARHLKLDSIHWLGFRDSGMAGTEANRHPEAFYRATFDEAVKRLVRLIRQYKPQVLVTYDAFGGYGHPDHVQAHRVTLSAFQAAGEARLFSELGLAAWQPAKLYYGVVPREFFRRAVIRMHAAGISGPWDSPDMDVDQWGTPEAEISTVLDVRDYVGAKMEAFRAHKTQVAPDEFMFAIPPERRREALGYEWYVLAQSKLPPSYSAGKEYDLFAGLR